MFTVSRTFADRLRELLAAKGWTPYKLAQECKLARSGVSSYLAGNSFPEEKGIQVIAEKLGVDADELRTFVRLSQIGDDYEAKVRRYVPELFAVASGGATRRAREGRAPAYVVPRMAAGEGNAQVDPDRVEYDAVDEPFSEE